jgi:mutual gliding-motility protein MglA
MVFFNYASMEMSAKIVYYGPGLCGKTTNLKWVFDQMPMDRRGEMVSLATETDRTLFFDLLPLKLGKVGDFTTRIQLYTVPGQVFYNSTRKLVLKGVDGIVFVADSQEPMLDANIESLENLQENLAEQKNNLRKIPWVIQYNKRDLPGILPVKTLNRHLNFMDVPSYESIATIGEGVMEALVGIAKLTLRHLRKKAGQDVPEDSEELLMFEDELTKALGTEGRKDTEEKADKEVIEVSADDKSEEDLEVATSVPEAVTEPPSDVAVDEPEEVLEEDLDEEALTVSDEATAPGVSVSVVPEQVVIPDETLQGEGIVIDKDVTHKIKIPIRISREATVSHINLNLKLDVECVLLSEEAKRTETKAERLAAKALEDFLLGKSKKKKS